MQSLHPFWKCHFELPVLTLRLCVRKANSILGQLLGAEFGQLLRHGRLKILGRHLHVFNDLKHSGI